MHAYLLVGQANNNLQLTINNLAKKLGVKILEFPLAKIEDARGLKSFTALKVTSPTAIYIDSIENATEEASNAFLKNLEEPQENLYYILTTSSLAAVLPTIVSRCEVIKLKITHEVMQSNKKLKIAVNPTLVDIDRIKDRGEAIDFIQKFIDQWHFKLINDNKNQKRIAKNLGIAVKTLNNLRANGNVNLQLSNMVINLI